MKVGFVGLGNMGLPIARNLARAGHDLTVYNRTRAKAEQLADDGVKIADSPAECCSGEVVCSMLADDDAVAEVTQAILASASLGLIHVSLSTISPALSRRLAVAHRERGQTYVAAPVFGRPEAAQAAKLVIVAAGPVAAVERCQPLFDVIGQKSFHVHEAPEKANIIKLCGNFMLASMLETLGETAAVMRKSEIDPKLFLEIVNGHLFRSPVYENYGRAIAEEKYEPAGFRLRLGLKDVKLVMAASEEIGVPMPLASLLRDHLLSGVARGFGDFDWAGLAKVVAQDAGL